MWLDRTWRADVSLPPAGGGLRSSAVNRTRREETVQSNYCSTESLRRRKCHSQVRGKGSQHRALLEREAIIRADISL